MQTTTLFNASSSASATSKGLGLLGTSDDSPYVTVQVTLSATGSVTIQGSLDGTHFYTLPTITGAAGAAITASGVYIFPKMPYINATITANTGTITVIAGV